MPERAESTQLQASLKGITRTPQPVPFSRMLGSCLLLAGCLAQHGRCRRWLNLNLLNCKVTQLPQSCSILVTLMFTTSLSPQFGGPGPPPTPALTQLTPSAPSSGSCYVPAFSSHTLTVTESHARPLRPAPSPLHHSAPGFRILHLVPLRCLSSALCAQTSLGGGGGLLLTRTHTHRH